MKYANLIGYSDVQPYEVLSVSKSGKQIVVRAMAYERDETWKPEFVQGGFVANCTNQNDQRWIIKPDADGVELKARKRKDGYFWSVFGRHHVEDAPRKFYDYNF